MAGAGGADRAYDLGAGYGNPKAKCRCCGRDSGKFPVYEAGAGSYITDHVSVLDLDASGGGIHAVTSWQTARKRTISGILPDRGNSDVLF